VGLRRGLPRDKAEAYEVLGANPEASDKILKRLVDALRATWHPDHARSEEDRVAREERIKQINVAWDLIQEKRVEA
ncbi:MAG: DnaJ domain-containing protein, partial [Hyphomicrobiaceae bacterium]|nr:DnaJ domain-containing protein [Hyphomicrobiaceae bacterium]